jgi:branched-chain amino acid transport system substrate-binding protein
MIRATLVAAVALATALAVAAFGRDDEGAIRSASPVNLPWCSSPVYGREGRPDVLIALGTSLQGRAAEYGVQDSQALKLVLAERGWRAGNLSVGLQICDEMTASRGLSSPSKCRRNARALARNRSVLGVVGPKHSTCALEMLPILNQAAGGPLVLIGTSSTYLGLTRAGPASVGGGPEANFPSGQRSFVRVLPADDVQGAAGAVFAKRQGARSVFVLNDCDCVYGQGVATAFRTAAERIGLRVAGTAGWGPDPSGYRGLAEWIRDTGADAVYLGGYLENNGIRLISELRAILGPRVALIASDGFASPAAIVEGAGAAAEGLAVTITALPKDDLPAAGREFADRFEERYLSRPRTFSMQTAQAAQILLDAIAGSNGSRTDVTKKVLGAHVEGGLLGDFEFDRYGDTTLNATGVYRIEEGRMRFETTISSAAARLARRSGGPR